MPVWFVLGVQSSAKFMVVNCEGAVFGIFVHYEPGAGVTTTCVPLVPDPAARCCQRKAPTTTITNKTVIPMLNHKRVRLLISFLPMDRHLTRPPSYLNTRARPAARSARPARTTEYSAPRSPQSRRTPAQWQTSWLRAANRCQALSRRRHTR